MSFIRGVGERNHPITDIFIGPRHQTKHIHQLKKNPKTNLTCELKVTI